MTRDDIIYGTRSAIAVTWRAVMLPYWRLLNRWRYRNTEPFLVTKIRDGKVTALQISRHSGKPLTGEGRNEAVFDLALADYLQVGDITVLGPSRD